MNDVGRIPLFFPILLSLSLLVACAAPATSPPPTPVLATHRAEPLSPTSTPADPPPATSTPTHTAVPPTPTTAPAPTSVPSPTPANSAPTPTPTPFARVIAETLNVRWGPATSCVALAKVHEGQTLTVRGRDEAGEWLLVHFDDSERVGWIAAEWAELSASDEQDVPTATFFACDRWMTSPAPAPADCQVLSIAELLQNGCLPPAGYSDTISTLPPTPTAIPTPAALHLRWNEAGGYDGQEVTVCGPVVRSYFASSTGGQPTFLDLGEAYPSPNRFTIVIWGDDRGNFPDAPEHYYYQKTVCVTGKVEIYQGIPEIKASSPADIALVEEVP